MDTGNDAGDPSDSRAAGAPDLCRELYPELAGIKRCLLQPFSLVSSLTFRISSWLMDLAGMPVPAPGGDERSVIDFLTGEVSATPFASVPFSREGPCG